MAAAGAERRAGGGGVGDDEAVDAVGERCRDDRLEAARRQVGGDLHQQRRAARNRSGDGAEDRAEGPGGLQVAQAGGVGRRDVDDEVVGVRCQGGDQGGVVAGRVGPGPVDPDVGADEHGTAAAGGEPRHERGETVVVQAVAVDDGPILGKAEHTGERVPGLGQRRDGPGLDEAEAEAGQATQGRGVLVEPGREADGIGEGAAERADGERRVVRAAVRPGQAEAQGEDGEAMRTLRIQSAEGGHGAGGDHGPGVPEARRVEKGARGAHVDGMWNEPYLETCCRSALHRLMLADETRPAGLKDGRCLVRLGEMGLAEPVGERWRVTPAGRARHEAEIVRVVGEV